MKVAQWASEGKIHFLSERILNRTIVNETTESKKAEVYTKTGVTRSLTPAQRKQARSTQKGCAVLHHNDDVTIYDDSFRKGHLPKYDQPDNHNNMD